MALPVDDHINTACYRHSADSSDKSGLMSLPRAEANGFNVTGVSLITNLDIITAGGKTESDGNARFFRGTMFLSLCRFLLQSAWTLNKVGSW